LAAVRRAAVHHDLAVSVDRHALADSEAAPRVKVRPVPDLARATTTAGRPGATATRVTDGHRAATVTMVVVRQGVVRRLARAVTPARTKVRRLGDRDRSAICCTAAMPCWRRSGPVARSAA
jgi:hypothetical protein